MHATLGGAASSIASHEDQVTGKLMKELYDKMQWNQEQTDDNSDGHGSAKNNAAKYSNVATVQNQSKASVRVGSNDK